ncbi:MAG: hypothetical protein JXA30_22735 [Deltaproteobacteria bacterium]|nr:hypothetical protein [Deltaproteobacteria bacterium]
MMVEQQRQNHFDIWNEVPLVPQTTGMSCWAASAAMIVGWRDRVFVDPQEVAAGAGHWSAYREGLDPEDVQTLARTWGLIIQYNQTWTVEGLCSALETHGPLWVGEASPGLHSIVVTGIFGDGTAFNTRVRINDPWPIDQGERYTLTFEQFLNNFQAATRTVGAHAHVLHTGGRRRGSSRSTRFSRQATTTIDSNSEPNHAPRWIHHRVAQEENIMTYYRPNARHENDYPVFNGPAPVQPRYAPPRPPQAVPQYARPQQIRPQQYGTPAGLFNQYARVAPPYAYAQNAESAANRFGPQMVQAVQDLKNQGVSDADLTAMLSDPAPVQTQGLSRTAFAMDNNATTIYLPNGQILSGWALDAADFLLATIPPIALIRQIANQGYTIGIGVGAGAGLGAGGGLGAGILFAPNNVIGFYNMRSFSAGFLASANVSLQFIIIRGGVENFSGEARAITVNLSSGNPEIPVEIGGGASIIVTPSGDFLGVACMMTLGAGLSPLEIYAEAQRTYTSVPTTQSYGYLNRYDTYATYGSRMNPRRAVYGSAENLAQRFGPDMVNAIQSLKSQGATDQQLTALLSDPIPVTTAQSMRALSRTMDNATRIYLPGGQVLSGTEAWLASQVLNAIPGIAWLRELANNNNLTIAVGVAGSAGILVGFGGGFGVLFAPGDVIGFYGMQSASFGFLASMNVSLQFTVVTGGVQNFAGECTAEVINVSTGNPEIPVEVGAGVALLRNLQGQPIGVTFMMNIGLGLSPVEVYLEAQRVATTVPQGQSLSRAPVPNRAAYYMGAFG